MHFFASCARKAPIALLSLSLSACCLGGGEPAPSYEPRVSDTMFPAGLGWVRFGETTEADIVAHYGASGISETMHVSEFQVPNDSVNRIPRLPSTLPMIHVLLARADDPYADHVGLFLASIPDHPAPVLVRIDVSGMERSEREGRRSPSRCDVVHAVEESAATRCDHELGPFHLPSVTQDLRCVGSADGRYPLVISCTRSRVLSYEIAVPRASAAP